MLGRVATGVLAAAGLWALVVLLAWLFQERLIYLPDASAPTLPADSRVQPVQYVTADGLALEAWTLAHPDPHAWVVIANGNAGNRANRLPMAQQLHARGYSVLLADYRGYGGNPGRPHAEGMRADIAAAVDWLEDAVAPAKVVLFGESIGSSVAAEVAAQSAPDVLILRSPFPSLADVARRHYPFLPVRLLLRDRHETVEYLRDVDVPALVIAGERDRIIPLELSRTVAERGGAELEVIAGADHNDAALFVGDAFLDAIDSFIQSHLANP